jgi:hypothetical protein
MRWRRTWGARRDPLLQDESDDRPTVEELFATAIRPDEFPSWSPRNPWAKKLTPGQIREGTRTSCASSNRTGG